MPTMDWKNHLAARKIGTFHVENNIPCQDYVDIYEDGECLIAALADGVGSLRYSEVAAMEAVAGTIEWFRAHAKKLASMQDPHEERRQIREILPAYLRERIRSAAEGRGLNVQQMDCNLAFIHIRKNRGYEDSIYLGVLGDCAICVIGMGDDMYTVCGTGSGPATDSVMHEKSAENFQVLFHRADTDGIRGFIMTSDGLAGEVYEKNSPYVSHNAQNYYNAVFEAVPKERMRDLFARLQQQTYFSDDLSIAVITREREPRTFREDPYWLCKCGNKNPMNTGTCTNCGREHYDVYVNLDEELRKGEFKDAFSYFRYLNQHPNQERIRIGLAPIVDTPTKEPAAVEEPLITKPLLPREEAMRDRQKQEPDRESDSRTGGAEQEKRWYTGQNNGPSASRDITMQIPAAHNSGNTESVQKQCPAGTRMLKILSIVLVVVNVLGFSVLIVNGIIKGIANTKTSQQLQSIIDLIIDMRDTPTEPATDGEETEQFCITLEDGSIYYGPTSQGRPHGYGTVHTGDTVMSGEFNFGEKNGMFLIRSLYHDAAMTLVEYAEDRPVGDPIQITAMNYQDNGVVASCLITREVNLYTKWETQGEPVVIPENTMVYLTGLFRYETGDQEKSVLWMQIAGPDGRVGWCMAEELGMMPE